VPIQQDRLHSPPAVAEFQLQALQEAAPLPSPGEVVVVLLALLALVAQLLPLLFAAVLPARSLLQPSLAPPHALHLLSSSHHLTFSVLQVFSADLISPD